MNIVLASTSPFRKQQMTDLGLTFKALPPLFDEDKYKLNPTNGLEELCLLLGQKKAESLVTSCPDSVIIGSDQMLVFENEMYNKPKSIEEVIERLSSLSNNTHTLLTSLFVSTPNETYSHIDKTHLHMKNLSLEEIQTYAQLDQPIGCAGGYKYELNGKTLFNSVETQDPSSIIGLPTLALKDILISIGKL